MTTPTTKTSIVLLVDGARADVMTDLLQKGELPSLQRYLVEPGSCRQAVTTFPSTTGPAYLPFLTGASPGQCNFPGIRWFDKQAFEKGTLLSGHRSYVGFESFMMGQDMSPHIQTLFELVPKSYSIFNPLVKGAGKRNRTRMSRIWYWYYAHLTDRWAFVDGAAVEKIVALLPLEPRYIFAVLPGVDEYSHLAGPHHEKTIEQYRCVDRAVFKLNERLKQYMDSEEAQLWIVSDHGLSSTETHFCLNTFLEKRGCAPFFYPLIHKRRGKLCANMVSGNGMSHLYFRHPEGWAKPVTASLLQRISPSFVDDLVAEPAIDILMIKNDAGGVNVLSKRGHAALSWQGENIEYTVQGSDPFGYPALPSLFTQDQSLHLTHHTDYPDALFQILNLFQASRTGDVVLSATPGFYLRLKYEHPEHRGSHGSLHRSHMMVPLICNQPLEARPARTVDVFPSVLESLGYPVPSYAEGKSLFKIAREEKVLI